MRCDGRWGGYLLQIDCSITHQRWFSVSQGSVRYVCREVSQIQIPAQMCAYWLIKWTIAGFGFHKLVFNWSIDMVTKQGMHKYKVYNVYMHTCKDGTIECIQTKYADINTKLTMYIYAYRWFDSTPSNQGSSVWPVCI